MSFNYSRNFNIIEHMNIISIQIFRLQMWNRLIVDIRKGYFLQSSTLQNSKNFFWGRSSLAPLRCAKFILLYYLRKWIIKCFPVWPYRKLNQVNLFHSNSLLVKQRFPFLSKSLISQNILEFCYTLEQEMTDKRNDCKKCM